MANVTLRNMLAEMGQAFKDWADSYFDLEGDNINTLIPKEIALNDFMLKTNTKGWSTNKFTKALRSWCRFYGYIFNPKSFHNGQKRIIKKIDGMTKDMIYVQTTMENLNAQDLEDDLEMEEVLEEDKPF